MPVCGAENSKGTSRVMNVPAVIIALLLHLATVRANDVPLVDENFDDRANPARGPNESLYNFKINNLEGTQVDFKQFQGKVILVVNVASECGFTDGHYRGLQSLHKLLSISELFSVVAFPCNQFGNQEPQDNLSIHKFVTKEYGASFTILEKVDVVGKTAHDFWKVIEGTTGQAPNWNFWKYLVNYQGHVINFWGPWNTVEEITPLVKDAVDQAVKEIARKRQSNESAGMPSTEPQNRPGSSNMGGPPPLPLHRARPPPSPNMPGSSPTAQAPPPPTKGGQAKPPAGPAGPPPPPKNKKVPTTATPLAGKTNEEL